MNHRPRKMFLACPCCRAVPLGRRSGERCRRCGRGRLVEVRLASLALDALTDAVRILGAT